MVKNAGVNYSGLVDARVRIRANAAPTFNSRRQMISLRLMCPGLATIKMMEAMPGGIVAWIEQRSSFPSSQQFTESVQSCGQVMLREPPEFDQGQAGSLGTNDGMRLPKSH